MSHSTGSADCPWPTRRIVGSICCGRNCIGRPEASYGRFCHVSAAASGEAKPPGAIPNDSAPRAVVGMLPQCQLCSASDRNRPASPSNSSRYAWPAGLGPGRRSEEHTSELQSQSNLVCRLLLEKKKTSSEHVHGRAEIQRLRRQRLHEARESALSGGGT